MDGRQAQASRYRPATRNRAHEILFLGRIYFRPLLFSASKRERDKRKKKWKVKSRLGKRERERSARKTASAQAKDHFKGRRRSGKKLRED